MTAPAQGRGPLPSRGRTAANRGAPYVPPVLAPAVVAVAPAGTGAVKVQVTTA